jgi:hypothetical protein
VPTWLDQQASSWGSPLPFPQATSSPSAAPPPACADFAACTCCPIRYSLAVARFLAAASAEASDGGDEDEALSPACRGALERLACRPCDPRGSGGGAPICPSLCDAALDACRSDWFAVDAATGVAAPCGASGGGGAGLVCTALGDLASSGAELCASLLALPVAPSEQEGEEKDKKGWCYDGLAPPEKESRRVCSEAAAAAAAQQTQKQKQRGGRASSSSSALLTRSWARWRRRLARAARNAEAPALLPALVALAAMLVLHVALGAAGRRRQGRGGGGFGWERVGGGGQGGADGGAAAAAVAAARAALARERLADQLAKAAEMRHRRADEALNRDD